MDKAALCAFLAQHRYGVVSSISAEGRPQSALVGIAVTPDLEIIFDTEKISRKYPNLIARPACSLVLGWVGEQTVQLEGDAFEPGAAALEGYVQTYVRVWPDGLARANQPGIAYLVVRPRWIRYSDYAATPAVIEEMSFP
jgi:hypothetical protein